MSLQNPVCKILQVIHQKKSVTRKCRSETYAECLATFFFELQHAAKIANEFKYFIKSLPVNDDAQRKYIESYGMFRKEGCLYKDLLSKLGGTDYTVKWRPECYLARPDLLVFEDLNLLGYSHLKHRTALQSAHIECALSAIAKMHAASIAYDIKDTDYGSIGNEFKELIAPIYEMMLESKKYRNVLCHRDLWQNNLLYKFERNAQNEIDYSRPIECVLIDFQICRYLPPIDVIALISVSTRLEHRKQFHTHYFQFFYDSMTKELNEFHIDANQVLSWDEFQRSARELEMLPLVINCVCRPLTTLSSEIILSLKTKNPERKNDAEYKEIVIESYGELLDCMFKLNEE